jgi:hypothetical protein
MSDAMMNAQKLPPRSAIPVYLAGDSSEALTERIGLQLR